MWFDGGFGIWILIAGLLNLAFIIAIVVAVVLGVRWLMRQNAADRHHGEPKADDTALELLRQRYARGEIDAARGACVIVMRSSLRRIRLGRGPVVPTANSDAPPSSPPPSSDDDGG